MIVTYLRSSSYGKYDWCQLSYYLTYCLGFEDKSGQKANMGNIVHKAMEMFAHKQLAIQEGRDTFTEEESGKTFHIDEVDRKLALMTGWEIYTALSPEFIWDDKIFDKVTKWFNDALDYNNGQFNPLKQKVITPEQYFDIEIDKPWAVYKDEQGFIKRLSIKGTVDLVTEDSPNVLHYVDYKTGQMKDWGTGKEKTYACLRKDPQLLMYFYALNKLYPSYDTIFVTIYFIQFNKPFTISFGKEDVFYAEEMLRKRFDEIKSCKKPKRIINNGYHNWKCKKLCPFYKNKMVVDGNTLEENVCDHIHNKIIEIGIDRVTKKYGKKDAMNSYTGGGRTDKAMETDTVKN